MLPHHHAMLDKGLSNQSLFQCTVDHLNMWRDGSRSRAGSRCRCALGSTDGCQIVQEGGYRSCNSPSWDIFAFHLQKTSKVEQRTGRKACPLQVLTILSCGRVKKEPISLWRQVEHDELIDPSGCIWLQQMFATADPKQLKGQSAWPAG